MKIKKSIIISALFVSFFALTLSSKETVIEEDWRKGFTPKITWGATLMGIESETSIFVVAIEASCVILSKIFSDGFFDLGDISSWKLYYCCKDSYPSDGCDFGGEDSNCSSLVYR